MASIKAKVNAFTVVFLFDSKIKDLDVGDVKKLLDLKEKEKVTLFEAGELGFGLISLDEQKKRISLEGTRIVFTDADIKDVNFTGMRIVLGKILEKLKGNNIKAIGINFDLNISKKDKFKWSDLFSDKVQKLSKGLTVAGYGIKLSLKESEDKKINLNFNSLENDDNSLVLSCNFHQDIDKLPNLDELFLLADKNYKYLVNILSPL